MALIEVKAEFSLVVAELRRIREALERAFPVSQVHPERKRLVDARDVSVVTDEKLWEAEQESG